MQITKNTMGQQQGITHKDADLALVQYCRNKHWANRQGVVASNPVTSPTHLNNKGQAMLLCEKSPPYVNLPVCKDAHATPGVAKITRGSTNPCLPAIIKHTREKSQQRFTAKKSND